MTTPFPFQSGATLLASQLNSITQIPTRTLTSSGTAVAADNYSRIILNGTAVTYTVNSATFDTADVVEIYNANSAIATIAAGAGVTLNGAAGLTLLQYQSAKLYAVSSTSFILWPSSSVTGWTAYTPTWTNLTVGNATQNFRYLQVGKLVFVIGSLTWGSTTSATVTGFIFSLPITSATGSSSQYWGTVSYLDSGTEEYVGSMKMASTTTMGLRVPNVAGTYATSGNTANSITPMTWTTNDALFVSFFYEAA